MVAVNQIESCDFSPLGQRGMFTTSSGLQIAYLGGSYDKKNFAVPDSESGRGGSNLVRTTCKLY